MQKYVIIAAGGVGTRMQSTIPKQFLLVHSKPVLYYTILQFVNAYTDITIILAVPKNYIESVKELVTNYFASIEIQIVEGGATRYQSVSNALQQINIDDAVIFVHDAARCMVSVALIQHCYEQTLVNGNAIPCITPTDSVRLVEVNENKYVDRNVIKLIQTPQTFMAADLKEAFALTYKASFTDEASVAENAGITINLVQGEVNNIKITTPIDLQLASLLLHP